jgi:hypothetical protein
MIEYLKSHPRVQHALGFAERYERHIGVGALLFGFVFDTLTLGRPDQLFGNVILTTYLLISAGCILYLTLVARRTEVPPILALILLQFCFGNLAGGLLVLYGQSGTFEGSLLFFIVLGAFILGNEMLRQRYARLNFNISAWFFLLLAYLALVVPILIGRLGTLVFLFSGLLSVAIVAGLLFLLYKLSPPSFEGMKRKLALYLGSVFVAYNALYFLNIIPPVPLSLQAIGIYHSVTRSGGEYLVEYEKPRWYEFFRSTHRTYSYLPGKPAYCFSAVFAPSGLSTPISHRWERYDEGAGKWQTSTLLSFSINGGRDNGYRGYSQKYGLSPGKWRCSVETARGALIGRTTFKVIEGGSSRLITESI